MEIIKKTPITWNGQDGWEVLVDDPLLYIGLHCEQCMYEKWNDVIETGADCATVHGCGHWSTTHFVFSINP